MDADFDFSDLEDNADKKPKKDPSKPKPKNKKVSDDDFIFDDLEENANKKQATKKHTKNTNNAQSSKIDYELLEQLENDDIKQVAKKDSSSILPPIHSNKKSLQNVQKPKAPSRIDHTLEKLQNQKPNYFEKERIANKKQSQDFDFAVDYDDKKDKKLNSVPINDIKNSLNTGHNKKNQQIKLESSSFFQEQILQSPKKSVVVEGKKQTAAKKPQSEDDQPLLDLQDLGNQYEQEYEDDYEAQVKVEQIKPAPKIQEKKPSIHSKSVKKLPVQNNRSIDKKAAQKRSVSAKKIVKPGDSRLNSNSKSKLEVRQVPQQKRPPLNKPPTSSRLKTTEEKLHKYEEQVEKAFPSTQSDEQIKRLKNDALNRLNDKIRDMIKGFSGQLTKMIDKNLILLRKEKPEGQIKEQIDGQPQDPLENSLKVLEQNKKNNLKQLQITQNQLQYYSRLQEKMKGSGQYSLRIAEEIQAHKDHIAERGKFISNMRNEIEKEGKKVMKIPDQNSGLTRDKSNSNFKVNLETRQMYTNAKLTYDKHARKLEELEDKLYTLDTKISDASEKKADLVEKAQAEGICFYTKQDKARYVQLKKRRQQLASFKSKFNNSIKSKQSLIQHEISDLETLVYDMEAKFDRIEEDIEISKNNMLVEIKKGKNNKKVPSSVKEVLAQLEQYMDSKQQKDINSEEKLNSLTLISDNIYKRDYHSGVNKNKTQEDPTKEKRIEYKNYLQEVAQTQKLAKAKKNNSTQKYTSQNNSTNNPFKRSITPGDKPPRYSQEIKKKQAESGKRIQRLWKEQDPALADVAFNKSSKRIDGVNSANLKHLSKKDFDSDVGTLLKNKEITRLIDKEKEKISLDEKSSNPQIKKPFNFRSNPRDKQPVKAKTPPKTPSEDQKYEEDVFEDVVQAQQSPRQIVQDKSQDINVKLQDKPNEQINEPQIKDKQAGMNASPFRNMRLKKDKPAVAVEKQQQLNQANKISETVTVKQEIISLKKVVEEQKPKLIQEQEPAAIFKPKRFNPKRRNQSQNDSYMPTAAVQKKEQVPVEKKQPQFKLPLKQPLAIQKENIKKVEQDDSYDPFKKFISKKQQPKEQPKQIVTNVTNQSAPKMLSLNKPRVNPFKKSQEQGKIILQPEHVHKKEESQFIIVKKPQRSRNSIQKPQVQKSTIIQNPQNPYLSSLNDQQGQVKRQGRAKKIKGSGPVQNKQAASRTNIYDNVEDMTQNPLLALDQPKSNKNDNGLGGYGSVNRNLQGKKQVQPNLDEMLGIKKKKGTVDEDLLIGDMPVKGKVDNIGTKKNPFASKKKQDDFFDDMQL